jgi:hypothetical protein
MRKLIRTAIPLLLLAALAVGPAAAEGLSIGQIELDRNEWGSRKLYVQADNNTDDTVRIRIQLQTVYPTHYLSGLEHLTVDTTVVLGPKGIKDYVVPFQMPGSFGRIVTRAMIHWKYDHYVPANNAPDSTFQIFNNVFVAKGKTVDYADQKQSIGPVYSVMDHFQMNFEYPRLVLYLLSRGETPAQISTLFEADTEYTQEVISELRTEDFFPIETDSMAPGILAISEKEGYALKPVEKEAAETFADWYAKKGQKELKEILSQAGIDDYTGGLPSLQMAILYTLLMEKWTAPASGIGTPRFEEKTVDLRVLNQPHWIVQGGEFFLPKLCLAAFDDNDIFHFGTFSPDPKLPFDKASIYDMRAAADKEAGSIIEIKADQMRQAVDLAGREKLVDKISNEVVGKAVSEIEKQKLIEPFKTYQRPYLADYIIRLMLGEYFIDHRPDMGIDCIKVGY